MATASADLDGDGTIDMVSATPGSGLVIGWGDATVASQLSADRRPVDVELADLDGDGVPEIVVLHQTPAEIEAFRIGPARSFTSAGVWPLAGLPHRFALADLDRDGRVDAVVARSRPGGLVVLTGGFDVVANVDFGIDIVDVAVGDLEGDTAIDALAVDVATSSLFVLQNFSTSGFAAPRSLPTGLAPELVKLVDFDADGHLDVITAGRAQASLAVHRGDGTGTPAAASSVPTGTADSLGFALVPGDGAQPWLVTAEPEQLMASELSDGSPARRIQLAATPEIDRVEQHGDAVVYAGEGFVTRLETTSGTALRERWRDRSVPYAWRETRLVSGDLDGDGVADLVLAQLDQLQVYLGRDDGSFVPGPSLATPAPIGTIIAADVSGDGVIDLVLGELGPMPALQVAIGAADGSFELMAPFVTTSPPNVLASIDTDGDGVYGVVIAAGVGGSSTGCQILHFAEDGNIAATDEPAITGVVEAVATADLNADGGEDLVVLTRSATDVTLVTTHAQGLLGWDAPSSRSRTTVAGADVADTVVLGLATGDIDGDGRIDGLLTHRTGVDVFLDLEDTTREPVSSALELDVNPALVSLLDLDADGTADLLYAGLTVLVGARGTGDGRFEPLLRQGQSTSAAVRLVTDGPPALALTDSYGLVGGEFAPGAVPEHSSTYRSLGQLRGVTTGDIDGDGRPDIVVSGEGDENAWWGIGVLWSSADGRLDRGLATASETAVLATADMDGEGGDEIIAVQRNGLVLVYYHEDGRLRPRTNAWLRPPNPSLTTVAGVEAGDRDGDGRPDVLVLTSNGDDPPALALSELRGADERGFAGDGVTLWTGTGVKGDGAAAVQPVLATGDFDADGRMDAAILPGRGKLVVLAWGGGEIEHLEFDEHLTALGAGDMDEDGASALLLGGASQVSIVPLVGRRPGQPHKLDIARSRGRLIAVEVDGVAPIDLVFADSDRRSVALRHSNGSSTSWALGSRTRIQAMVDLDADGRADFIDVLGNVVFVNSLGVEEQP